MPLQSIAKAYAPRRIPTPALAADIELTDADLSLSIDSPYRAARLLIRIHGRPVGYADIVADASLSLGREQIIAALDCETLERATSHVIDDLIAAGVSLAHVRPELSTLLDRAVEARVACRHDQIVTGSLVTVAICTRDRPSTIGATLESLFRQSYRNIEVLVVDNAPSDDSTERLVRGHYPHVRYIREARRGLNYARNRAIAEARGSLLAFIDDDAVADERWVQAIVAAFDTPDVMCVTGIIVPARLDTPGQELFERYGYSKGFYRLAFNLASPPAIAGFPYRGYLGTGCNSAFRRSVFDHVGFFDPSLDMGTPVPGGGDHDMFARVIRSGYTLVYDPSPIVFHDHIADLDMAINRLGEYQESFMAFMAKSILNDDEYAMSLLGHIVYWYFRRTLRSAAAAIVKKNRPLKLVVSEAIGAWRGPISLYRSRRLVQMHSRRADADLVISPIVTSSDSAQNG